MDKFSQPSSNRIRKRVQLDPCYFVIATEGIDEIVYFKEIEKLIPKRFNAYYDIHIVEKSNEHNSSINHIYNDLDSYLGTAKTHFRGAIRKSYMVFDHDNNFENNHIRNTRARLREARLKGYVTIYSNPCFDLWLMLHYQDVTVRDDLSELLLNKRNYVKKCLHQVRNTEDLKHLARRYKTALENARKLLILSDHTQGLYPSNQLITEVLFLLSDIIESGLLEP